MDDRAEKAFRDALRQKADEPDFRPLRLDSPRPRTWTRWLPAAAALVLVAAIAIPLLLNRLGTSSPGSAAPAQEADARATSVAGWLPAPAAGRRWESYRVLTYQVPVDWGYGYAPRSDWCVDRQSRIDLPQQPIVAVAPDRGAVRAILCPRDIKASELRMFAAVRPAGAVDRGWDLPSGWSMATRELNGYVLEVVHPAAQSALAEQVVASVRPLPAEDAHGCPSTVPRPVASASAGTSREGIVRASLCQYDLGGDPPLVASRTVPTTQALGLRDVLESAPGGAGPDDPTRCVAKHHEVVVVRLWNAGGTARNVFVYYDTCEGNGVFADGRPPREVTVEVCEAVLRPPLVFTSGSGPAASRCARPLPVATPSAVGKATPSPNPTPSGSPTR